MKIKFNIQSIIAIIILSGMFIANPFVSANDSNNNGNKIISNHLPVGSVVMWGNTTIPENWIALEGQSTAMYPELSTIFGSNLPDMRGQFARNSGGNAAALGVIQNSDIKSHTHSASFSGNALPPHSHTYSAYNGSTKDGGSGGHGADNKRETKASSSVSGGTPTGTVTLTATGSGETRPNNVALLYIVKTK